jgi:hypothetical protein
MPPFKGRIFTLERLFDSLELLYFIISSHHITVFEFGADQWKPKEVALAYRHKLKQIELTPHCFLKAHHIIEKFIKQLSD